MDSANVSEPAAADERPMVDVLVQGPPSVDLTFLGLPHLPRLGEEYNATGFAMSPGACFINSAALTRLGVRAGFATDLGNDLFSGFVLDEMRSRGIDERFVRMHDRALMMISVGITFPHDRVFITWDEWDAVAPRGVLLEDLQRYHVRCLFSHLPFLPEVYAEARRQGIRICIDSFWHEEHLASPTMRRALEQADIFLPNLPEAYAITGTSIPEAALAALAGRVPMVAIKMGADGAIGSHEGRVYRVPALPVQSVDTTGAGDNFVAGFIYGLLRGMPFAECLRCAVVAGSLSTRRPGGVAASATEEELHQGLAVLGPAIETAHLSQS